MHVHSSKRARAPGMRGPSRSFGITLIELVVVIAIIAILASLLLPALARAKASALSVKCKSNLRQIGLGLRMYLDDEGFYPRIPSTGRATEPWDGWAMAINHYLNQPMLDHKIPNGYSYVWPSGLFRCPADPRREGNAGGSYGYNSMGIAVAVPSDGLGLGGYGVPRYPQGYPSGVRESAVSRPVEMLAIGDGYMGAAGPPNKPGFAVWDSPGFLAREGNRHGGDFLTTKLPTGAKRHQGVLNMLFCDGHIDGMRIQRLFYSRSDEDMRLWNNDNQPHRERLHISPH